MTTCVRRVNVPTGRTSAVRPRQGTRRGAGPDRGTPGDVFTKRIQVSEEICCFFPDKRVQYADFSASSHI